MSGDKKDAKNQINLIPKADLSGTALGRMLDWVLGTFRVIVILVEIVVIAGFVSRFWLDSANNELAEQIMQKQAILQNYSEFENSFKEAQLKLEVYAFFTEDTSLSNDYLNQIFAVLPLEVRLTNVTHVYEEFVLEGISVDERSVMQLISNLNSLGFIKETAIKQVEAEPETTFISFTLISTFDTKFLITEGAEEN